MILFLKPTSWCRCILLQVIISPQLMICVFTFNVKAQEPIMASGDVQPTVLAVTEVTGHE